jgi:uncharacterized membrane protein YgcG
VVAALPSVCGAAANPVARAGEPSAATPEARSVHRKRGWALRTLPTQPCGGRRFPRLERFARKQRQPPPRAGCRPNGFVVSLDHGSRKGNSGRGQRPVTASRQRPGGEVLARAKSAAAAAGSLLGPAARVARVAAVVALPFLLGAAALAVVLRSGTVRLPPLPGGRFGAAPASPPAARVVVPPATTSSGTFTRPPRRRTAVTPTPATGVSNRVNLQPVTSPVGRTAHQAPPPARPPSTPVHPPSGSGAPTPTPTPPSQGGGTGSGGTGSGGRGSGGTGSGGTGSGGTGSGGTGSGVTTPTTEPPPTGETDEQPSGHGHKKKNHVPPGQAKKVRPHIPPGQAKKAQPHIPPGQAKKAQPPSPASPPAPAQGHGDGEGQSGDTNPGGGHGNGGSHGSGGHGNEGGHGNGGGHGGGQGHGNGHGH